jgi:dolichyl-diphosphooligosaccharide--protein glycosyltransferase
MLIAIVVPIVLSAISRLMAARAWRPVYYPLTLLGLAGIALGILYGVNPDLFGYMSGLFGIFSPTGAALTVLEIQGLTASMAWGNFNTSFFIAFISFAILIYVAVKERSASKTLFLVWSVVMLMAVLGQRRFGYYYVINAALLTGYFSWKLLDVAGLGKLLTGPREVARVAKAFKKKKKTEEKAPQRPLMQSRGVWIRVIVMGIVVFFLVFFPSLGLWREQPTRLWGTGGQALYIGFTRYTAERPAIIDEGWYTSCLWLKDNTPDPLNNPEFYYELYPPRGEFEYPETAYGVMSWWDYGHFIMQLGHRIPNANPMQAGADRAGQFFTAQNESSANAQLDRWGSKYVAIDNDMATGKFYAMAEWAGKDPDDFYEIYYLPQQGGGQWLPLYYPTYYNSTAARLYNFDAKAVVPTETIVIAYEEKVSDEGDMYKEIIDGRAFPTYEEAEAYLAAQVSGDYRIVGASPYSSPIPLERFNSYELVYSSDATVTSAGQTLPSVKIFEYLGSDNS